MVSDYIHMFELLLYAHEIIFHVYMQGTSCSGEMFLCLYEITLKLHESVLSLPPFNVNDWILP